MTTAHIHWPSLPLKQIIPFRGKLEYYLKARDTSEDLIPSTLATDGHLSYQFYYNKASKLVGYRFSLDPLRVNNELFPRVTNFTSSVMASYVPSDLASKTEDGDFFVVYHDLNVRLIRYTVSNVGQTYCILMRAKLTNLG